MDRKRLAIAALLAVSLLSMAGDGAILFTALSPIPTAGPAEAPLPSPDGRHLAFTAPGYRGLTVLDLETGATVEISAARGAGFHPVWSPSGESIAFRTQTGGLSPKVRIVVAHPNGETETASPLSRSLSLPFWSGETLGFYALEEGTPRLFQAGPDAGPKCAQPPAVSAEGRLWVTGESGLVLSTVNADKVYYLPVSSPDGSAFVVECLDGRLYLGHAEQEALQDLGPGSYPSFVRDGRALLFERTADDGHRLVSGDLYLMDLETLTTVPLTQTPDRIERRPAMAADGRTVFFEEGGRLWRGVTP